MSKEAGYGWGDFWPDESGLDAEWISVHKHSEYTQTNVARHEAGHALVDTLLGQFEVVSAEIYGSESWSGVVWSDDHDEQGQPLEVHTAGVMGAIAGVMAVTPGLIPDEVWDELGHSDLRLAYDALCKITVSAEHERVVFRRLVRETADLLDEHRAALNALTQLLSIFRYLEGDAVRGFIAQAEESERKS